MKRVIEQIKETIATYHMINSKDTIIVGVSGGADSTCLFFALQELREQLDFKVEVVHVYHNLRKEGLADADYVREICEKQQVPYHYYNELVDLIAKEHGYSLEEAGRICRYRAFADVKKGLIKQGVLPETIKIAVAHNQNDRAETMLFQLFRGSGLRGMAGMLPVRDDIIRPLLNVSRDEIEQFLQEREIKFCIDHTNYEDTYTRNKIRNKILPVAVGEIFPETISNMARTADILGEAEDFLITQMEQAFAQCQITFTEGKQVELSIDKLLQHHSYLQKQMILHSIFQVVNTKKDITSAHVKACLSLCKKEGSGTLSLPYNIKVKKQYGTLMIGIKEETNVGQQTAITVEALDESKLIQINLESVGILNLQILPFYNEIHNIFIENKYTKCFDYDKIKGLLQFRKRVIGDCITITKCGQHQKIKKYMIQEKIPADMRNNIWLLADDTSVLWVVGYRISERYKVDEHTKRILKVQLEEEI